MLEYNQAGIFTDLWALGCILYQMLVGVTPFHGKNYDEVFNNILDRRLKFPSSMNPDAQDLIDKLLDYNPESRIGYSSYDELKDHPFFVGIDFEKLQLKQLQVPDSYHLTNHESQHLNTEEDEDGSFVNIQAPIVPPVE